MTVATCCAACMQSGASVPCGKHTGSDGYYWWDLWIGTTWIGSVRATERMIGILGADLIKAQNWAITPRNNQS